MAACAKVNKDIIWYRSPAYAAIHHSLPEGSITSFWNDAPGRTIDQVLKVVDNAIERVLDGNT